MENLYVSHREKERIYYFPSGNKYSFENVSCVLKDTNGAHIIERSDVNDKAIIHSNWECLIIKCD